MSGKQGHGCHQFKEYLRQKFTRKSQTSWNLRAPLWNKHDSGLIRFDNSKHFLGITNYEAGKNFPKFSVIKINISSTMLGK